MHCTLFLQNPSLLSYYNTLSTYRIRTETNGGAWCPKNRIDRDSYEYLQIDLGRLTVITMVEIQGRFGNGQVGATFSSPQIHQNILKPQIHQNILKPSNSPKLQPIINPYPNDSKVEIIDDG